MKIAYKQVKFSDWKVDLIHRANRIIADYREDGYDLTLRQLYYQFVSRDLLPSRWVDAATGSTNNERSYKNLGELISDARMAGLINWDSIEDRTRELVMNSHWQSPSDIIEIAASQFAIDKWQEQPYRVEIWVEKDALEGVVSRPAKELDINFFSCRGYTSQTSMHEAALRFKNYIEEGQKVVILHLGDHDPSGIDMSRDIEDRLNTFLGRRSSDLELRRIALNMDQIKRYAPPPNPAKVTDSRANSYIQNYGKKSWELDALEPSVINTLITKEVLELRDDAIYAKQEIIESRQKNLLELASNRWESVVQFLREDEDEE